MAEELTEVEKACAFFDGCHTSGATTNQILYNIGIILCATYQAQITPEALVVEPQAEARKKDDSLVDMG
jgi:hypothetical protein